ncbi:MlaA family lipoprotein, partial [Thioalkalivibrio sp.]|uniref:MlaA family lipoprotein n=1 Tax=Thioalkalivibrio sp. TaxID=2093813 RepID=UPI0012D5F33A
MRPDIPRAPLPRMLAVGILLVGLFGCASVSAMDPHSSDPFERYNRAVFAFNQGFDRTVLTPAAKGYRRLPDPVQTGIGNFFGNMADVRNAVNNLLQGKFENAATDTGR